MYFYIKFLSQDYHLFISALSYYFIFSHAHQIRLSVNPKHHHLAAQSGLISTPLHRVSTELSVL